MFRASDDFTVIGGKVKRERLNNTWQVTVIKDLMKAGLDENKVGDRLGWSLNNKWIGNADDTLTLILSNCSEYFFDMLLKQARFYSRL